MMQESEQVAELRCSRCGHRMECMGKSTGSGNEIREYYCHSCGHFEWVNSGTAFWRALEDVNHPLANEEYSEIRDHLPPRARAGDGVEFLGRLSKREEAILDSLTRLVASPGSDRVLSAVAFFLFNALGREPGVDEIVRRLPPENRGMGAWLSAAMADARAGEVHARGLFDHASDPKAFQEDLYRLRLYAWPLRSRIFEAEARRRLRREADQMARQFLSAVPADEPLRRVFRRIVEEMAEKEGEPYSSLLDRIRGIMMPTSSQDLEAAVRAGDFEAVRRALDAGADPNLCSSTDAADESTPMLYLACQSGHANIVRLLLERGAHANEGRTEVPPREYWNDAGRSARASYTSCLFAAMPNIEIMRALLEKGARDPSLHGTTSEAEKLLASYRTKSS